jgi:uncharacterized membrane protein
MALRSYCFFALPATGVLHSFSRAGLFVSNKGKAAALLDSDLRWLGKDITSIIFSRIICGTALSICGAVLIKCGAVLIICGAVLIICGAVLIICGAVLIICGAVLIICGVVLIICGVVLIICGVVLIICGPRTYYQPRRSFEIEAINRDGTTGVADD